MYLDVEKALRMGVLGEVRVRLDGITQHNITAANEEEGWVELLYYGTDRRYGHVQILLGEKC